MNFQCASRVSGLLALSLLFVLPGCGESKSKTEEMKKSEANASYQISENGCDTGKHEFSGSSEAEAKGKMCTALQDESLNRSCARSSRAQYFKANCPGTFTPVGVKSDAPESNESDPSTVATTEYQFTQDGDSAKCETGLHVFTDADPAEVTKQLCKTLPNEKKNRYCALGKRYALFLIECEGQEWTGAAVD